MKNFFLSVLLATGILLQAQQTDKQQENGKEGTFQVTARYNPILNQSIFTGNVGFDVRATIVSVGKVALQADIAGAFLKGKGYYSDAFIWNPGIYAELNVSPIVKPYLGIGYDFFKSNLEVFYLSDFSPQETHKIPYHFNGFNINPGIRAYFNHTFFIDFAYDYVNVKSDEAGKSAFNLLNIGLGARF